MNRELEFSFVCLDWSLTNKDIIGYNYYKPKKVTVYTITDIYLDTEDRLLQQNKYVLRKRLSTKNASIIYTIKGPTMVIEGVPGRLEIESDEFPQSELFKRIPDVGTKIMMIVQQRITSRTEVKYNGYDMFIDKTIYENGAEYFNIELENYELKKLGNMKGFAKVLGGKIGIYETNYSKFQIGEVVKKLNIEGRIDTDKYMKILGYK